MVEQELKAFSGSFEPFKDAARPAEERPHRWLGLGGLAGEKPSRRMPRWRSPATATPSHILLAHGLTIHFMLRCLEETKMGW
jgi:hypothetical protein